MLFVAVALGLVGLLVIYIEFFLPGGFLAGVGAFLLLLSCATFGWQNPSFFPIFFYVLVLIALTLLVCKVALWQMKKGGTKKGFYLDQDQEGFSASSFDSSLIGKTAVCVTELKPAGHILVEGDQWQAISESGYVPSGAEVLITGGRGAYFTVKRKEDKG